MAFFVQETTGQHVPCLRYGRPIGLSGTGDRNFGLGIGLPGLGQVVLSARSVGRFFSTGSGRAAAVSPQVRRAGFVSGVASNACSHDIDDGAPPRAGRSGRPDPGSTPKVCCRSCHPNLLPQTATQSAKYCKVPSSAFCCSNPWMSVSKPGHSRANSRLNFR